MHKHHLPLLLALLALTGCRTNPACERQIGLMRSELLALEDKYYLLDAKYREAVGQGNGSIEVCEDLGEPVIAPAAPGTINPSRPSDSDIRIQFDPNDSSNSATPQAAPIAATFDPSAAQSVVTFQTPTRFAKLQDSRRAAELDEPGESTNDAFAGDQTFQASGLSQKPANSRASDGLREFPEGDHPETPQLTVLVDSLRLQGPGDDAIQTDDGLSLVVHIPDDRWSPDGILTVSVLDPNEVAERQRIGLWRFTPEEIGQRIDRTAVASSVAIPLEVSWNQNTPNHSNLMLFVRWEHPQFPVLDSSQPIAIASDSANPDSFPVGYEEDLPEVRLADQMSQESPDLRNPGLPSVAPQWQPNR